MIQRLTLPYQTMKLNRQRMEQLRSTKGGYTKALTEALGVPWPLVKGWKTQIESSNRSIIEEEFSKLLKIKDVMCPKKSRNRKTE